MPMTPPSRPPQIESVATSTTPHLSAARIRRPDRKEGCSPNAHIPPDDAAAGQTTTFQESSERSNFMRHRSAIKVMHCIIAAIGGCGSARISPPASKRLCCGVSVAFLLRPCFLRSIACQRCMHHKEQLSRSTSLWDADQSIKVLTEPHQTNEVADESP